LYFLVLTNNPAVATKHRNLKLVLVEGDVTAVYKKSTGLGSQGTSTTHSPVIQQSQAGAYSL